MKHKLKTANFNLFLLPSDTEMTKFIGEVLNLGEIFPEIYTHVVRTGFPVHGASRILGLHQRPRGM